MKRKIFDRLVSYKDSRYEKRVKMMPARVKARSFRDQKLLKKVWTILAYTLKSAQVKTRKALLFRTFGIKLRFFRKIRIITRLGLEAKDRRADLLRHFLLKRKWWKVIQAFWTQVKKERRVVREARDLIGRQHARIKEAVFDSLKLYFLYRKYKAIKRMQLKHKIFTLLRLAVGRRDG